MMSFLMVVAIALAGGVVEPPAQVNLASQEAKAAKPKLRDEKSLRTHVLSHVTYPTTKAALVEACNKMSDVPAADKKWFAGKLPDGSYSTPEDVLKALGL